MKKIMYIGIFLLLLYSILFISISFQKISTNKNNDHPEIPQKIIMTESTGVVLHEEENNTPEVIQKVPEEETSSNIVLTPSKTNIPLNRPTENIPKSRLIPSPLPQGATKQKSAPCVYNHAYQQNYRNDSINSLLSEANDCYVLIDPYQDNAYKHIPILQAQGNSVGCYISVGTGEDWRNDFTVLQPYLTQKEWNQWEGEYFVSTTSTSVLQIMKNRIATLSAWGCDYVEFDNMDWAFDDDTIDNYDLDVTYNEAIVYNQTLCAYAHSKGMKCMAKNTREGASMFDGATYESYPHEKNWWDMSGLKAFLSESKLGLIVHYNEQNCDSVYEDYRTQYGNSLSFICENRNSKQYKHY